MEELLSISEAAKLLGVSEKTMREWDQTGKLKARRTLGNHRRYSISDLRNVTVEKSLYDSYIDSDRRSHNDQLKEIIAFWRGRMEVKTKDDEALCVLLDNYLQLSSFTDDPIVTDDMVALIKATWRKIKMKEFISIQPMTGPTALVFALTKTDKGAAIESEAVCAKTHIMQSCRFLPSLPVCDNLEFYSTMLADEFDAIITQEILSSAPLCPKHELADYDFLIIGPCPRSEDFLRKTGELIECDDTCSTGLTKVGRWNGHADVYRSDNLPVILDETTYCPIYRIIGGKRGSSPTMSGPMFYCPYMLLSTLPRTINCSNFRFFTRNAFYFNQKQNDMEVFSVNIDQLGTLDV